MKFFLNVLAGVLVTFTCDALRSIFRGHIAKLEDRLDTLRAAKTQPARDGRQFAIAEFDRISKLIHWRRVWFAAALLAATGIVLAVIALI